jgi:hypothetical protein
MGSIIYTLVTWCMPLKSIDRLCLTFLTALLLLDDLFFSVICFDDSPSSGRGLDALGIGEANGN